MLKQLGGSLLSGAKGFVTGSLTSPVGIATWAVTLPIAAERLANKFEQLARRVAEANDQFGEFSGQIAASSARRQMAERMQRRDIALATSSSASLLNQQLATLTREVTPIKEAIASTMNYIATGMTLLARAAVLFVKLSPTFILWHRTMQKAEGRGSAKPEETPLHDFLRDVRAGHFRNRER